MGHGFIAGVRGAALGGRGGEGRPCRVQLQQVVVNLLINAIQAMAPGGADARDLVVRTRDESGAVLVEVDDSGPGIAPEAAGRLFTAFYTTKPAGMGIGLSICKSIIEAHGGRIGAARKEGRGSVFRFTLPAGDGAASRPADVAAKRL